MTDTPVSGDANEAVVREDRRRRDAIIAADIGALEPLLADGLVYIHGSGKLDGKASYVAAMASRKTTYRTIGYSDLVLRNLGPDAAMMRGKIVMDVESGGAARSIRNHFSAVWAKGPKGWQLEYWQSTSLPAEA